MPASQGDTQQYELETKWSDWCKSGNIIYPDCEQLFKLAVDDPDVSNSLYVELYRETDLHGNAKSSETVWKLFSLAAAVFLPRVSRAHPLPQDCVSVPARHTCVLTHGREWRARAGDGR